MVRTFLLPFVIASIAFGSVYLAPRVAAQSPLSLAQILTGLTAKRSTSETSTPAKRNEYIRKRVEALGVTFTATPEIKAELRNAGASEALIASIVANGPGGDTPSRDNVSRSKVRRIWIDQDTNVEGQLGMLVHLDTDIAGYEGAGAFLIFRIQTADGDYLKGDGEFANGDGDLQFQIEITPDSDVSRYRDATVFIPYDEIGLSGTWNLKLDVDVARADGEFTEHLTFKEFQFNAKPVPETISGGVLNGRATNLVKPPYPAAARAVRASGAVNVQVTIDENGDVIEAAAVSGHPLLRAAAVAAARASKFSPTLLAGAPVKVTGVIIYNFQP